MKWFILALKKYAQFSGRSQRSEYWYYVLFLYLAFIALIFVDIGMGSFDQKSGVGLLTTIVSLATLIPSFAVTCRRLHDTDHSGWWWLIAYIPLIGAIVLLVFLCRDGTDGPNRFGENPKAVAER